jgi:hypothetical protein
MGFFSPWFLGGLLAVGVPIYVHLLRQHKTTPLPFSSTMFFERRTQSSIKHRRLKYLALLAMRLAIIVLLALMFANPFVNRPAAAVNSGKRLVIVAVDNSFSMRTSDRMARAKQEALSALGSMRAGDTGQVITFASTTHLMTQPTDNTAELRAAVEAIHPGDGRSSYGEIARAIRSIALPNGPPVDAHVISDMQLTSLPSPFSELALNTNTRLVLHSVADTRDPNWFVESVNAPQSVYQAKKTRVQATVAGAGTDARELQVALVLNGKALETRKVAVPANGRTALEFYLPDAAHGFNRGEVRVDGGDKLPADDVFGFSLERKEPSRSLFVHEARNARAAHYYRTALESNSDAGFSLDIVTPDQAANVSPERYSSIVLSDVGSLPQSFEQALTDYVKRGGALLVSLGAVSVARGRVPVLNDSIAETRYASREGERFQLAGSVDQTHPVVSRVHRFEGVKFYQSVKVDSKDARILARLTDGTPLLLERKLGSGRVLVFASTFDNIANDLPLSPVFLPFVEQAAMYLSGIEAAPAIYLVDSFLELRSGRDAGSSVEVIGPDGERALTLKEAATAQTLRLTREGYYEVRRGNGRNELIAVHADRRESDLGLVPKETLALWQNAGGVGGPAASPGTAQVKPFSLWWYFALVLLAIAVLESLFAGRYLEARQDQLLVRKQAA